MEIRTDASYRFSDRYMGDHRLELFNAHYLSVSSKRLKRKHQFKLEVATLNPEAKKVEKRPWHWLAAALLCLVAAGYLLSYLLNTAEGNAVWAALGGTVLLVLLGAAAIVAFRYGIERKWVFETRASQYPLVCIPYDAATAKEAAGFVTRLTQAIVVNNDNKGYSEDDLFAGEMRMLRRLSRCGVISDDLYNSAKKQMLDAGRQNAAASA